MARPDKPRLKEALVQALSATLETLEHAHADAREAATHAEAKPENDKDTRALEQSYLARGQAMRVEELRRALLEVKAMPVDATKGPVAVGALVTAVEEDETLRFFIAPAGGGTKLAGGVQVVTPKSPLGEALVGRRVGDVCELKLAGRARELEVEKVE